MLEIFRCTVTGPPRSRRPRERFLLLQRDQGSMSLHLPRCCSSKKQFFSKLTPDSKRASNALSRAPLNCCVFCLLILPHSPLISKMLLPSVRHKALCLVCCAMLHMLWTFDTARLSAVLRFNCHAQRSQVHFGRHVLQSFGVPDSASKHVRSLTQYAPCVTLGKNALLVKFWFRV